MMRVPEIPDATPRCARWGRNTAPFRALVGETLKAYMPGAPRDRSQYPVPRATMDDLMAHLSTR